MKTVLAPIDFSRVTAQVIEQAITLARAVNGRVVLMHAVPPPVILTEAAPIWGQLPDLSAGLESARRKMRDIQKSLARRGSTVETLCQPGLPVPLVLSRAQELAARYIVLGSHGHSALYDLLLGSTASMILKRARLPVVIVPAPPKGKVRPLRRVTRRAH